MIAAHTKRMLDGAINELKRNGYMVLLIMMDTKSDEAKQWGNAVDVMCSETNDPKLLAAMLQTTMDCLTNPKAAETQN